MKIIDLSMIVKSAPGEPVAPRIKRIDHRKGAVLLGWGGPFAYRKQPLRFLWELLKNLFKPRLGPGDFPGGMALSDERITLSAHTGTHVDAPAHYGPLCEGKTARTIDEVPLEWCMGNGVVLDLREKPPGSEITIKDLENAQEKIGYNIKQGDVVLLYTGADDLIGKPEYFFRFPGMGHEATAYLIDKGIRLMGTDAYGFDRPFGSMINDYAGTGDRKYLWPAHMIGRDKEYIHIERLANLGTLPTSTGFTFMAFPVKVADVGACWTRAVALYQD